MSATPSKPFFVLSTGFRKTEDSFQHSNFEAFLYEPLMSHDASVQHSFLYPPLEWEKKGDDGMPYILLAKNLSETK
jgi:hypothetical protein